MASCAWSAMNEEIQASDEFQLIVSSFVDRDCSSSIQQNNDELVDAARAQIAELRARSSRGPR